MNNRVRIYLIKLILHLLVIILPVLFLNLTANSEDKAKINIGLMFGPTVANISGSYIKASDEAELGFTLSLTLNYQFNNTWSFITGVTWIQKGGKKIEFPSVADSTYDFQSQYLQVPLLVKAALPISGDKWYFGPFTGLAFNLNAGCSYKNSEQFEFEEVGCDETTPGGNPEKFELSIPFGVNIWREFQGGSRFIFEIRYEPGLNNIFKTASKIGQSAKNNLLAIRIGFSLPLHK